METHSADNLSPLPPIKSLMARIGSCMLRDKHVLRRQAQAVRNAAQAGRTVDRMFYRLQNAIEQSEKEHQRRLRNLPRPDYPPELPVTQKRDEIARAIAENQVVVLCGETGSGKTTQLPKICLELGRGVAGLIGHTQPRRIAARSVAMRLAQEMQSPLGRTVGYKVRFSDQLSEDTYVKLMTDGILLAEIQNDRFLEQYDTIIIDEAHERSLNIDFLLGYLKQLLPKRPDLKLIITSATIDPERFSRHFNHAPIVMVSGRTYPVEVRYRPLPDENSDDQDIEQRDAIVAAIDELWRQAPGDMLVFLSGEREIRQTAEALQKHHPKNVQILPLYARLSTEDQLRVFQPHEQKRIVLATNVAETSLTVPGIRYVIDPGLARISRYSSRTSVQRLPIEPVSQASADQRKGRCGRVSEGICIRLYSQENYESRPQFTDPEIRRTHLASVILQMKSLRLGRIEDFPFLNPPDYRQIRDGYQTLHELGAIDEQNELTEIGRILSRLPIDPRIGRMILAGRDQKCLDEILIIASGLSLQDPRERPLEEQHAADNAHRQFRNEQSDFLAYLNLWQFYHDNARHMSENKLRKLCRENFLSFIRLREWHDIHSQLRELAYDMGWRANDEPATYDTIHRALLAGLLGNIGTKGDGFEYKGIRGKEFHLFPGSVLFQKKPKWVMAAELVETTRLYARTVAEILPEWIEQAAAHMVRRIYTDPHWQRRAGQVLAHEKVTLHGLPIIPRRNVHFGPVDPKTSREIFIHAALVRGDYDTQAPYYRHNKDLVRQIELLEAKTRRRDILVDTQTQFAFYDSKIPAHVHSEQLFERWRHHAERLNRRILFMTPQDLMLRSADEISDAQFPSTLTMQGLRLSLSYRFDPGHPADGVTATVPLAAMNQIDSDRLDWLVPGLLLEKITDLIRTLPKEIRVNLVPVPEYAQRALHHIKFGQGRLIDALAGQLGKFTGLPIPIQAFRPEVLPDYLRMNIRVLNEAGKQVAMGRDLPALRRSLRLQAKASFAIKPPPQFHRDHLRQWDFGDLPRRIEIQQEGMTLQGFPALIDQGDSVSLRLLDSEEAARQATRTGVRRLFMIEFQSELKYQIDNLLDLKQLYLWYATIGSGQEFKRDFTLALADRLILGDAPDVRTLMEYELRLESAWNRLRPAAEQLAAQAAEILSAHHHVSLLLDGPFPPLLEPAINDMRQQLTALVPANFLSVTPPQWLGHIPRFIKGIELRLKKLTNAGMLRDTQNTTMIAPLWHAYLQRQSHHQSQGTAAPELTRFRWLIEELRVSLYAQELKTSIPVSVQRLEKQYISPRAG